MKPIRTKRTKPAKPAAPAAPAVPAGPAQCRALATTTKRRCQLPAQADGFCHAPHKPGSQLAPA